MIIFFAVRSFWGSATQWASKVTASLHQVSFERCRATRTSTKTPGSRLTIEITPENVAFIGWNPLDIYGIIVEPPNIDM